MLIGNYDSVTTDFLYCLENAKNFLFLCYYFSTKLFTVEPSNWSVVENEDERQACNCGNQVYGPFFVVYYLGHLGVYIP